MGLEGTGCLSARILNLDSKDKFPGGGAFRDLPLGQLQFQFSCSVVSDSLQDCDWDLVVYQEPRVRKVWRLSVDCLLS